MGDVDIVGAPYAAGIATDAYPDGLGAQQLLPPSQLGHTDNLARTDIPGLGHRTPRAALQTLIAAKNILAACLLEPAGEPCPLERLLPAYDTTFFHPPPWLISCEKPSYLPRETFYRRRLEACCIQEMGDFVLPAHRYDVHPLACFARPRDELCCYIDRGRAFIRGLH